MGTMGPRLTLCVSCSGTLTAQPMPARPSYPDPVAPTMSSPLHGAPEGSRCGDTFTETIEVRRPYGETDIFVRQVPTVWNMALDISRAFPKLEERIGDGIAAATTDLDAYVLSGEVDQDNFHALDAILDRAAAYLSYCVELAEYWNEQSVEYVDSSGISQDEASYFLTLPLTEDGPKTFNRCWQASEGKVVRLELSDAWIEFKCPGAALVNLYKEDWERYKDTLLKAAKQLRCAQEGLYSLVAYNVNRAHAEGGPVGPPVPPKPGETLRTGVPKAPEVPSDVPVPSPEQPPPAEPGWSKNKKIAVGVAALGIVGGGLWLIIRKSPSPVRVTNWTYPKEAVT